MKVAQDEAVDRQTVLTIELEDDDIDPYLERSYRQVVQRVNVPGFRKGKAPRRVVERLVGRESLLNEVLDAVLSETTFRAIEEQGLDSAGMPSIEIVDYEPLSFRATVPLQPHVDLGAYRDIRVDETPTEFDEDAVVTERLEELRATMATWHPVERPLAMGDLVSGALEYSQRGVPLYSEPESSFILGEEPVGFATEIGEGLVGATAGEERTFSVQMPEGSPGLDPEANVDFRVEVKDYKEPRLPDLDDDFALGLAGDEETLEQLTERIRDEEREAVERLATNEYDAKVLDALEAAVKVELPPLIVEHGAEHAWQEQQQLFRGFGIRLDDFVRANETSIEAMREEAERDSRRRLVRIYAMNKLIEAEAIEVSEEEAAQRVEEILEQNSIARDATEDEIATVRNSMLSERAMERLRAIARGEDPKSEPAGDEAAPSESEGDTTHEGDDANTRDDEGEQPGDTQT